MATDRTPTGIITTSSFHRPCSVCSVNGTYRRVHGLACCIACPDFTVLAYGDRGVAVKLESFSSPGPRTVFWSASKNSYVITADERGPWRTSDGIRVALVSVNGIGEVRWTVERYMLNGGTEGAAEAVKHFGLEEWTHV